MIELINASQDPGQGLYEQYIDVENYARSTKHLERAKRITELLDAAKAERDLISQRWVNYYRNWEGTHDIKYYEGEADLRLRLGRKILDTFTAHIYTAAFPGNEFFRIKAKDRVSFQKGQVARMLIEHDLEQAELSSEAEQFLDLAWIHGISYYKVHWKTRETQNYRLRQDRNGQVGFRAEPLVHYSGPTADIVDPMRLFVWPITAKNILDAEFIFEEMDVSPAFLRNNSMDGVPEDGRLRMYDKKKVDDYLKRRDDKKEMGHNPQPGSIDFSSGHSVDGYRDERVEFSGHSTVDLQQNTIRIKEVYGYLDLYGNGIDVPIRMTVVDDGTIIELRQNPFVHQMPPYLMTRVKNKLDNFYGQGLMELIEDYQYAIDALLNQGIDNINFQTNPIILINELAVDRSNLKVAPRAVWGGDGRVRDNFDIVRPPNTASDSFNAMAQMMGIMQDVAGAPPVLQGKSGPRAETAFGMSALQGSASMFVRTQIQRLEKQVYSRMLWMFWMLEQQYRGAEAHKGITTIPRLQLEPQDFIGDYDLEWMVNAEAMSDLQLQQFEGGMTTVPGQGGQGQQQNGQNSQDETAQQDAMANLIGSIANLQGEG